MSIIVTNEITVPAERAERVAEKFAENSRRLSDFDGFEGFELCRPTEPADDRWLVITRWRDEDAFQQWLDSSHFSQSHPKPGEPTAKGVDARAVIRRYAVAVTDTGN
ncbi:antibiotic biosynthesis monooxygenase family protein [Trueperella sp. LYQ143]|uniref:antibiotic biosynthesis monooxygenase family protein n=1 Tax=unclassified Trueperella TaxID=2630174 RepID=UPI003982D9E5